MDNRIFGVVCFLLLSDLPRSVATDASSVVLPDVRPDTNLQPFTQQDAKKTRVSSNCPEKCPVCTKHIECPNGVKIVRDRCGCCTHCARQEGEDCDISLGCDQHLQCHNGACRDEKAIGCKVGNRTYLDGEIWNPNCQTICQCQNGIYGCADVCRTDVSLADCKFGRQLVVESECCSRWVCRTALAICSNISTEWTECSCVNPVSYQWSNHNFDCQWHIQQRRCLPSDCPGDRKGERMFSTKKGTLVEAKRYCSSSMYQRYEYIEEDNCRSTELHLEKTCASECHVSDGSKLCCTPNEFSSVPVWFSCPNRKTVLRTLAVIAGCKCQLC